MVCSVAIKPLAGLGAGKGGPAGAVLAGHDGDNPGGGVMGGFVDDIEGMGAFAMLLLASDLLSLRVIS